MARKERTSPRARRGSEVIIEAGKLDASELSPSHNNPQLLAAAWLARRFGLTPCRASLVAELSGLGRAA